ncbi:unnamed protein product [Trichobilharzia regenti]|nr:unnamed protein product [Trichobilharzia regenti]
MIRWCFTSPIKEIQWGSCVLLSQFLAFRILELSDRKRDIRPVKPDQMKIVEEGRTAGNLVWSLLIPVDKPGNDNNNNNTRFYSIEKQDIQTPDNLLNLIKDSHTITAIHGLSLLNNLMLCMYIESNMREILPQFTNELQCHQICRFQFNVNSPIPKRKQLLVSSRTCILLDSKHLTWFFDQPLDLCVQHLHHNCSVIRQYALLCIGNALFLSNDFSSLGNTCYHIDQLYDSLCKNNVLHALLETGCLDGDRRVQEAALAALRALCLVDDRLRQDLSNLNTVKRLNDMQANLKHIGSNRSGRKSSARSRMSITQLGLIDYDVISQHATAICNLLSTN